MDSVSYIHGMIDLFIAHAPAEIPEWFTHVSKGKCPKIRPTENDKFGRFSEHPQREIFRKHWNEEDDCWEAGLTEWELPPDFRKEVIEWRDAREVERQAFKQWKHDDQVEKYFQWRIFYADELIKRLNLPGRLPGSIYMRNPDELKHFDGPGGEDAASASTEQAPAAETGDKVATE